MVETIMQCDFRENHLEIPASFTKEDTLNMYRLFQQAVLDAHLPVTKAIGFALDTGKKIRKQSATERCSYCLESMVEIASNLDDKIFLDVSNNRIISSQLEGKIVASNNTFTSNTKPVKMLYLKPEITTTIKPLSIEIYVDTDTGYRQMSDNSRKMGKIKYFPMNSYHTVMDYVRVLPFDGTIRYKLLNGMTPDILRSMFMQLYTFMLASSLGKEDMLWVSSFQR